MAIFTPVVPDKTVIMRHLESRPLSIDLFYPRSLPVEPLPVVVFIHGGGWSGGSRHQFFRHARELSDAGFLGACIEYRLSGEALFPAPVEDCSSAISYLNAHSTELNADVARIAVIGSSAGSHLAAALGAGCPVAGIDRAVVPFVVAIHGIFNLESMYREGATSLCTGFVGSAYDTSPDIWQAASPLFNVSNSSADFLMMHDPADTVVPFSQSQEMAKRLIDFGRNVCFHCTPGSGHGFIYNRENPHTVKAWPRICSWLSQNLTA